MKASPQQSNNSPARSTPEAADSRRENPAAGIGRTAAAQQKMVAGINDSPRMALQRRRIEGYLGMVMCQH